MTNCIIDEQNIICHLIFNDKENVDKEVTSLKKHQTDDPRQRLLRQL